MLNSKSILYLGWSIMNPCRLSSNNEGQDDATNHSRTTQKNNKHETLFLLHLFLLLFLFISTVTVHGLLSVVSVVVYCCFHFCHHCCFCPLHCRRHFCFTIQLFVGLVYVGRSVYHNIFATIQSCAKFMVSFVRKLIWQNILNCKTQFLEVLVLVRNEMNK
jgi:hypothetical protein